MKYKNVDIFENISQGMKKLRKIGAFKEAEAVAILLKDNIGLHQIIEELKNERSSEKRASENVSGS